MSPWSVIVESQISSKTKHCNIGDLKPKHPSDRLDTKTQLNW